MLIVSYVRLGRSDRAQETNNDFQTISSTNPLVPNSIRPDQGDTSPIDAIIGAVLSTARATSIDDTSRGWDRDVCEQVVMTLKCICTRMPKDEHSSTDTSALLLPSDKPSGP